MQRILAAQILVDADLRLRLMLASRSLCLGLDDIRYGYCDLSGALWRLVGTLCLCDRRGIEQERTENDSR